MKISVQHLLILGCVLFIQDGATSKGFDEKDVWYNKCLTYNNRTLRMNCSLPVLSFPIMFLHKKSRTVVTCNMVNDALSCKPKDKIPYKLLKENEITIMVNESKFGKDLSGDWFCKTKEGPDIKTEMDSITGNIQVKIRGNVIQTKLSRTQLVIECSSCNKPYRNFTEIWINGQSNNSIRLNAAGDCILGRKARCQHDLCNCSAFGNTFEVSYIYNDLDIGTNVTCAMHFNSRAKEGKFHVLASATYNGTDFKDSSTILYKTLSRTKITTTLRTIWKGDANYTTEKTTLVSKPDNQNHDELSDFTVHIAILCSFIFIAISILVILYLFLKNKMRKKYLPEMKKPKVSKKNKIRQKYLPGMKQPKLSNKSQKSFCSDDSEDLQWTTSPLAISGQKSFCSDDSEDLQWTTSPLAIPAKPHGTNAEEAISLQETDLLLHEISLGCNVQESNEKKSDVNEDLEENKESDDIPLCTNPNEDNISQYIGEILQEIKDQMQSCLNEFDENKRTHLEITSSSTVKDDSGILHSSADDHYEFEKRDEEGKGSDEVTYDSLSQNGERKYNDREDNQGSESDIQSNKIYYRQEFEDKKSSDDASMQLLCKICDNQKISKNDNYCIDCGLRFCTRCSEQHKKNIITKKHARIPLHTIPEGFFSSTLCEYHLDENILYYCSNHKTVICRLCSDKGHTQCKKVAIEDIAPTNISGYLEEAEVTLNDFRSKLRQKQEVKRTDDSHLYCKKDVHNSNDKTELTPETALNKDQIAKLDHLSIQVDSLKTVCLVLDKENAYTQAFILINKLLYKLKEISIYQTFTEPCMAYDRPSSFHLK